MSDVLNVRFRHTQGDVGPLKLPASLTVQAVKERLLLAWPKDGPLGHDPPGSAMDVKLILSGKFLDSSATLESLKPSMGELKPDTIVTIHTIVRAPLMTKTAGGKLGEKEETSGCACSIM